MEYKPYIAEIIGTFALIFFGAGAILANAGLVGIALAHGLAIMAGVYAVGHISGAHFNPAVTISMLITKKIEAAKGALYIVSQLIGASLAAFMLKILFSGADAAMHLGAPALGGGVTLMQGILAEAILTFFLVWAVFGTAVDKRAPVGIAGIAIGLTITMDIFAGGGLTGAAMNPARAFGPSLIAGFWTNQIVYWIGPIVGGAVAALLYNHLLLEEK